MDHYYIFTLRKDERIPFYERTVSSKSYALNYIASYERRGYKAFFTINCLPKEYWY